MAEIAPIKLPGKLQNFAGDDVALLGGMRRTSGEMTFQDPVANGGNVVTLAQLLSGVGGLAWTDLSDTPGTIQADQVVFANAAGSDLAFRGVKFANVLATEPVVTGIINPGDLELSVFSGSQIQIAAGDLAIANRVNPLDVRQFLSNHAAPVQIAPVNINSRVSFWTASDAGFSGLVTIKEYSTHPTVGDLRVESLLGISLHSDSVVVDVINSPDIYRDQGQSVDDLLRRGSEGAQIQSGTGVASEIPGTLQIETTTATVESKGIGFHSSGGVDPNHASLMVAQDPFEFDTIRPDGSVFSLGLNNFPKTYNNLGTETALTGKRAAVHQVAWMINGQGICQLGTTQYNNWDNAVSSIVQELLLNPLWPPARALGATIGVVVISNDATTLWLDGVARMFPVSNGQISVGGVTNYLGLADTPGDRIGKDGQVPSVNDAESEDAYGKIRTQIMPGFPGNVPGAPLTNIALPIPVNAAKFHIDNIHLEVKTAETVTPVIIDINIDGTTIFPGAKPTLGTGVLKSDTAVSPDAIAVKGQAITVDLDAGGVEWQDLTVAIQGWAEPE